MIDKPNFNVQIVAVFSTLDDAQNLQKNTAINSTMLQRKEIELQISGLRNLFLSLQMPMNSYLSWASTKIAVRRQGI